MRTSRVFALLFLFAASSLNLRAGTHFTVSVEVTGVATNEINSCLCRELRELKDVTVTESTNAIYRINITSIAPSISGQPVGYALAILISRAADPSLRSQAITADLVTLELQGVKVIALAGLPAACHQIISDLDTAVLAKQRRNVRAATVP